jgi:glyoxylase-like metal-dependent hydrolase (beta-lactamase superfamily II)
MTTEGWHEVGREVFRRRFDPFDVTVTVILGGDGAAVVDTRCCPAEARELKDLIRRLTPLPIRWVVNTHAHFDHTWGNAEFANAEFAAPRLDPPAGIWAHETVPDRLRPDGPDVPGLLAELTAAGPEWPAKLADLEFARPTGLVAASAEIDLGGRVLELRHHGRGHTDGDLWIGVPDAAVVLAGDLVEQSGPPAFGPDSFPLEWPDTLGRALAWMSPDVAVVPGHGEPVGCAFVENQCTVIMEIARETMRLHAAAVPLEHAAEAGTWPFPADELGDAVARGYAALAGATSTGR